VHLTKSVCDDRADAAEAREHKNLDPEHGEHDVGAEAVARSCPLRVPLAKAAQALGEWGQIAEQKPREHH